jgi:hypothetical protein
MKSVCQHFSMFKIGMRLMCPMYLNAPSSFLFLKQSIVVLISVRNATVSISGCVVQRLISSLLYFVYFEPPWLIPFHSVGAINHPGYGPQEEFYKKYELIISNLVGGLCLMAEDNRHRIHTTIKHRIHVT